jgi:hypothetical protein
MRFHRGAGPGEEVFATYGWDFWRQSGAILEGNLDSGGDFDFSGMLPLPPSAQSDGLPPPPTSDAVNSTLLPQLPKPLALTDGESRSTRPRPRWRTLHPVYRRREATGISGVRPCLNLREQKYEARCRGVHLGTFHTTDAAAASIAAASVGGPADLLQQRRMRLMEATADAFVSAAVDTGVDDLAPPHSTSGTSAPLDAPENTHHLAVKLGLSTHTRAEGLRRGSRLHRPAATSGSARSVRILATRSLKINCSSNTGRKTRETAKPTTIHSMRHWSTTRLSER